MGTIYYHEKEAGYIVTWILSVNQKNKQTKTNIEKILDNEYIKLLSYSLGNGIEGIFSLSIFRNCIKLAWFDFYWLLQNYFLILFIKATSFPITVTYTYLFCL